MNRKELIDHAFSAMKNSYAPYSNYHVGACVACKDGRVFYGANIENASYGATNCAERSAMFSAYSNGIRKDDIEAIAIVSDGDTIATPCGICHQVMAELLNPDTPVFMSNGTLNLDSTVKDLLPFAFTQEDLKCEADL